MFLQIKLRAGWQRPCNILEAEMEDPLVIRLELTWQRRLLWVVKGVELLL